MATKIEIGPRLEKLLVDMEQKLRADAEAAAPEEDDLDDGVWFDIHGEVRYGDLDLDIELIATLIDDTPMLLLLRCPYDENEEEESLHSMTEYAIQAWLIEELTRRLYAEAPVTSSERVPPPR